LSVAMTAPRNVADMVQPKPLDADAQATLADVSKRHVCSLDKTCRRPPPLITLTRSLKGEEVVTKAVLGQNLELLLDVCNAFPHSAPSKPSLEKPLADCLDWHRSDVEAGAKRKWAKDET